MVDMSRWIFVARVEVEADNPDMARERISNMFEQLGNEINIAYNTNISILDWDTPTEHPSA